MNQNKLDISLELENNVQRYLQLGEDLHRNVRAEAKEIKTYTTELGDTTKRFIAHFDVFRNIGDEISSKVSSSIDSSAKRMAANVADGFSQIVDAKINQHINHLNQAVRDARNELQHVNRKKTRKNILIVGILAIACSVAGFSVGHAILQKQIMMIGDTSMALLTSGAMLENAWPYLTKEEQEKIKKLATGRR